MLPAPAGSTAPSQSTELRVNVHFTAVPPFALCPDRPSRSHPKRTGRRGRRHLKVLRATTTSKLVAVARLLPEADDPEVCGPGTEQRYCPHRKRATISMPSLLSTGLRQRSSPRAGTTASARTHASSPTASRLSCAARTSPASRRTSSPGCADHTTPGGRGYPTVGCRFARSCTSSGLPQTRHWCGRVGRALPRPPRARAPPGEAGTPPVDRAPPRSRASSHDSTRSAPPLAAPVGQHGPRRAASPRGRLRRRTGLLLDASSSHGDAVTTSPRSGNIVRAVDAAGLRVRVLAAEPDRSTQPAVPARGEGRDSNSRARLVLLQPPALPSPVRCDRVQSTPSPWVVQTSPVASQWHRSDVIICRG